MHILVLGGTKFVGRWFVEAALARGHKITLFNRGSKPGLFTGVEELRGDREQDLSALVGRRWDAVVDTCGYVPGVVRRSAELLRDRVGRYLFVSSLSVYAKTGVPGQDERAPLAELPVGVAADTLDMEYYGPLKVLCERVVEEVYADRALIVRPGLIVGPRDPTGRFTYWPRRIADDGEVLAPGRSERPVQFIDARDLAAWMALAVEGGLSGAYNAVSPDGMFTMGVLLETCCQVSGNKTALTWIPDAFLLSHGVAPWQDLPLWLPKSDPETAGFLRFNSEKAIHVGLSFRPLVDTVTDLLAWNATPEGQGAARAGISLEREREILQAFHREGEG